MLAERDASVNISHRAMPSWDEHIKFVNSKPYQAWYFICDPEPIGTCYLTERNEIGVFIHKQFQGKGYGKKAVEMLMQKHGQRRYLANISPENEPSAVLFAKLGFKLVQHTFERV